MEIVLTKPEVLHLALTQNERVLRDTQVGVDTFQLRSLFIRANFDTSDVMMFELDRTQLRAIDMLLTDGDPREAKLPDGNPVMQLVEKVWRCLCDGSRD